MKSGSNYNCFQREKQGGGGVHRDWGEEGQREGGGRGGVTIMLQTFSR